MSRFYDSYDSFPPYVPVAERRHAAERKMRQLRKKGRDITPIEAFRGNRIAKSFWGHAWCRHLESYSDYDNRLPRGRTYVRNGSVCHLEIGLGQIKGIVCGSELYDITIRIDALSAKRWALVKKRCTGKIGSLLELLQGSLSDEVMTVVTSKDEGLFPSPKEIHLDCNCPDWAGLCKHLAAALYGVGVRLDDQPDLLFKLRGVDHNELIESDISEALHGKRPTTSRRIASDDLADVFGIEVATETASADHDASPETTPSVANKSPISRHEAKKGTAKSSQKKPARRTKPTEMLSPTTGTGVRKLRRRFGMTEYEFGFIIDVSAVTVRTWEAKGKMLHNARATNQEELNTIAQLSKSAAWDRLNDYL